MKKQDKAIIDRKSVDNIDNEEVNDIDLTQAANNDVCELDGLALSSESVNSVTAIGDEKSLTKLGENEVLTRYIREVSSFPILTQEEEEKLFNLYLDNGDQKAGQAIVLSHLRLVVKIAMQYKNFGINMMDVIAEGNVGLMIALQKFDRTKNARFATYAGLWIKAKVQEFILKSWNMIKIGSSALRKQLLFNFNGLKKLLYIDNETSSREQSKKIAAHFGIDEAEYENAVASIKGREASLEAPIGDDGRTTMIDTIETNNGNFADRFAFKEENIYRNKIFQESLSILDDRQKDILIARYLHEPKTTLEELSEKYGISKERVRQIEESAIKKLKKFAEDYDK